MKSLFVYLFVFFFKVGSKTGPSLMTVVPLCEQCMGVGEGDGDMKKLQ